MLILITFLHIFGSFNKSKSTFSIQKMHICTYLFFLFKEIMSFEFTQKYNHHFHFTFRTFDRIHENRVVEIRNTRSQSAERRTKKSAAASKLEAGSSATLTRGFHLPQSSRSLWQRVFVGKICS